MSPAADLPRKATDGSSGYDLKAVLDEPLTLTPGQRAVVPTGLALEMTEGVEAQVRPRSGLAAKSGVTVLNAPGTIDSDYRGEVGVILINLGQEDVVISGGDRVAQLVFARVENVALEMVSELNETGRGEGGFGSTGSD